MKALEAYEKIQKLWQGSNVAKSEEWARQFGKALAPYEGDTLRHALNKWLSNPPHEFAPKPHELAKICRGIRHDNAGASKGGMTEQQRRSWERLQTPYQAERRIYRREEIDQISDNIAELRRVEVVDGICEVMAKYGEGMLKRHSREVAKPGAQDR